MRKIETRQIRPLWIGLVCLAGGVLFGAKPEEADPKPSASEPTERKAAVVPITGEITDVTALALQAKLDKARAEGMEVVILRLETPGGMVKSAMTISKMLKGAEDLLTVAYVDREAISAGALIALACDQIVCRKGGKIGDCAPIVMGGTQLGKTEREKIETYLRTEFRDSAQRNGYNPLLAQAMVTISLNVYKVQNTATGEIRYVDKEGFEKLFGKAPEDTPKKKTPAIQETRLLVHPVAAGSWVKLKTVVTDEQLLTMTDTEALEYGFAKKIVNSDRDLAEFYQLAWPLKEYGITWSEHAVGFLNSSAITGLLFMVALLALYMELQSPGVGLPGAVALICFAVIFGSKYMVGLAEWWEIALFVIGLGLLTIEIFVVPGFGLPGVLGTICVLAALVVMVMPTTPGPLPLPATQYDLQVLERGLLSLAVGFLGFVAGAVVLVRYLPKVPYAGRLVLAGPVPSSASPSLPPSGTQRSGRIGQKGKAISTLRPAGKAEIDGQILDVVTEGDWIVGGREVVITNIHGSRIVVART